jgi:outer membrane protein assembly factor BamB
VVVGGYDGLVAHRPDGSVVWERADEEGGGDVVAVRPGGEVCYTTGYTGALVALDPADGTLRWSTDLQASPGYAVVPTSRGPYVPVNGGVEAFDWDGNRRYRVFRGRGVGPSDVAVADAVYVTDVGMAERLEPRGFPHGEGLLDEPPGAAWRVEESLGYGHAVAVDDGEVYVTDERSGGRAGGVLALDTSGRVLWRRDLGEYPSGMAIGPQRVFVAMGRERADAPDPHRLFALDRADGATVWTGTASKFFGDPVIAGSTLLVAENTPDDRGRLRAFDRDGTPLWSVAFDDLLRDITPVGDRIYAVTADGRLHVLS